MPPGAARRAPAARRTPTARPARTSAGGYTGTYENGSAKKGGTYTVGWEQSFGFTDNFDPTGEYLGNAWGILDNLLVRPLIGYKHASGADGNELIGDLATSVPKPTDNGLTYTYKLRSGIKFGPPVNRVITSKDVAYALDRLADPKNGGQYGFYYSVIKGWDAAGKNGSHVSGVETPDNNTLVIHLTKATGDFNRRMSMPATAPIPSTVGDCFKGKPGAYGRNVISSGPYMLAGSAGTFTSCSALKPFSGYAGDNGNHLTLVRNPNYDQSTDSYRKNYPDKFAFVDQLERRRHLQQGSGRPVRRRAELAAAEDDPAVRHRPEPEEATAGQRRRPHLVHHDEPDAAAVRRHPRPQGDELHHRQAGAAQGVGRPGRRRDRHAHRPAGDVQQRARRVRPVRDSELLRRPGQGPGGDEEVEVLERHRHVQRVRLQGRAAWSPTPARSTTG